MKTVYFFTLEGKAMKKTIMILVLLAFAVSSLGCIGYGVITHGGNAVNVRNGVV